MRALRSNARQGDLTIRRCRTATRKTKAQDYRHFGISTNDFYSCVFTTHHEIIMHDGSGEKEEQKGVVCRSRAPVWQQTKLLRFRVGLGFLFCFHHFSSRNLLYFSRPSLPWSRSALGVPARWSSAMSLFFMLCSCVESKKRRSASRLHTISAFSLTAAKGNKPPAGGYLCICGLGRGRSSCLCSLALVALDLRK